MKPKILKKTIASLKKKLYTNNRDSPNNVFPE